MPYHSMSREPHTSAVPRRRFHKRSSRMRERTTGSRRWPPAARHGVLFVLCLMYFVAYVDRVNISVAGPLMRRDLGLTPIQLGLIFSAFAYPYAGMQIAGGWAADRFGPRLVLAALSLLWATATILTGVSWSVGSLLAFRLLVGVGEGGAFPAATRAPTPWLAIVRSMWLVTVVDFCYGWSLWVFLTWLPSYLSDSRGFAFNRMALVTMLPLSAGVVSDTLGGVISDTIYRRTGNLRLARRAMLVVGLGGASAFMIPAVMTGSALGAVYLL